MQDEKTDFSEKQNEVMVEIRKHLRPEFINRLDEIVIFNNLSKENLKEIILIQIEDLKKRLGEKSIELKWGKGVSEFLLSNIEYNRYGARPLRRKIEKLVENKIAIQIIKSKDVSGGQMCVSLKNKEITVDYVLKKTRKNSTTKTKKPR